MPLLTHVLWGSLFCIPFGFSFTALRFSTLTLGLIGILGTYFLLREVKSDRYIAFMGAMLLASNPIYVALSNTFMTDVPFTAFTPSIWLRYATTESVNAVRRLSSEPTILTLIGFPTGGPPVST